MRIFDIDRTELADALCPSIIEEGEVTLDPKWIGGRRVSPFHRDGYCLGYWVDCEWEGPSPLSRLFAAAPDLLEACKAVLPDLERYVSTHGPGPDRRLDMIRTAIAKATQK